MLDYLTSVFGVSAASHFDTLLHVAFDTNLAYAALLRVGQLQGTKLKSWCDSQFEYVSKVSAILKKENEDRDILETADCHNQADAFMADAHKDLSAGVKIFSFASLTMMLLSIIMLVINAADDPMTVPNWIACAILLVLFSPVPVGLFYAHYKVGQTERKITREFDKCIGACNYLKKPQASAEAISALRQKLNVHRPNTLMRMIGLGND